jgi:hypothetical protein
MTGPVGNPAHGGNGILHHIFAPFSTLRGYGKLCQEVFKKQWNQLIQ